MTTDLRNRATQAERDHQWEEAAALFLTLGHQCKDNKQFDEAGDYFMRAAVAGERAEEWRKLGYLWMQCAAALECRAQGAVADIIDPLDHSKHFFPTLDYYAWERFSNAEKVGRAYRNAAYHLELSGSNQSAYVQFSKAGDAFREGRMLAEASRSYYHALLSFIQRHGELDMNMLNDLERVNAELISENELRYLKRTQLYFRGLGSLLKAKGNYSEANNVFCKEADISRRLALRDKRLGAWCLFTLWKYSSRYGSSSTLWAIWAVLLFALIFPLIFRISGTAVWQESAHRAVTWIDYVYFSLATVTTAADSSFWLSLGGKIVAAFEGLVGFLMLGSLLSLVAKRFVR